MNDTLTRIPIKDQIYSIIKYKILSGQYMLGEKLSIISLTKELNVSNSPVREALSMLERDGLVEALPNVGPSVVAFSQEKFLSITQAVEGLLLGSLEIVLQNGNIDNLIDAMQAALKEQIDNVNAEKEETYAKYSIAFEASIVKCCDNAYLSKLYDEMEGLFLLIVLYDHWYIDTARNQGVIEHQRIIGALQSGDFNMAKDLLIKHYDKFKKI